MKNITREQLKSKVESGELYELHTAWTRRYVSRKGSGVIEQYRGKYGEGYALYTPSWQSTTYCHVTYYVK